MRRINVISLLMILCVLLSCSENKLTGTISDTDTGKSALVYNPDLTPAVNANVSFYKVTDTVAIYKTITDKDGNYTIPVLDDGTYNIIAKKDSLMSLQDSVVFVKNNRIIKPDTLGKTGSITAVAALQVNHDPRTVTVHVLGTNVNSNVDDKGIFSLKQLARGSYNIVLKTSLPDYAPKYATIKIECAKNDTLKDTIYLTYTGIPVVAGLKATYDTTKGVVTLSWNKTNYRDFQDYLIYRDSYDAVILSTLPVAAQSDTVFADTLFKNVTVDSALTYHYKYRVAVRSNTVVTGATYKYIDLVVIPPGLLDATILNSTYHTIKNFATDSASVNDTLLYKYSIETKYRGIQRVQWKNLETSGIIHDTILNGLYNSYQDSFKLAWPEIGLKRIECKVTDIGGYSTIDTLKVTIVNDLPVLKITFEKDTVFVNDTVLIKISGIDRFGSISKWELSPGNTGKFAKISGNDTSLIIDDLQSNTYECVFKCTDDDGGVKYDTISFVTKHFKPINISGQITNRSNHSTVTFNNKLWITGGSNYEFTEYFNDVWSSEDGIIWKCELNNAPFGKRYSAECTVFKNRIWISGGHIKSNAEKDTYVKDLWSSVDGKNWQKETVPEEVVNSDCWKMVAFKEKLWVIYQTYQNGMYNYDMWNTTDVVNWELSKSTKSFPISNGIIDAKVLNDAIYLFGENSVWSSTDGVNWSNNEYIGINRPFSSVTAGNDKFYLTNTLNSSNDPVSSKGFLYSKNGYEWNVISLNESYGVQYGYKIDYFNQSLIISGADDPLQNMIYMYRLTQ